MTTVNDPRTSTAEPGARVAWQLAPVVVLRQAGFPMELLAPLADPAAAEEARELVAHGQRLKALAEEFKAALRRHPVPGAARLSSPAGFLLPVPEPALAAAAAAVPAEAAATLRGYQDAARHFAEEQTRFAARHQDRLDRAGAAVVEAFGDERLRQVLLLSNDSAYPTFAAWLDGHDGTTGRRTRKMTDLLTMYLQRVTTKNETHSHFGPFTPGRLGTAPGITWTGERELERHALFSHWAAEKLAQSAAAVPGLLDHARPRRRPLSFLRDGRIDLYAFTTRDGLDTDWDFQHLGGRPVEPYEAWLWQHCDGERTLRELRQAWQDELPGPGPFDTALAELADREWVVVEFEIPIGDHRPLAALREQLLAAPAGPAAPLLAAIDGFEADLTRFARLPLPERAAALAAGKARFEQLTGGPANRNSGLHYADRSILFEEARGRPADLTVGPDLARFITDELSIVYETVLAGPRLRMRRELVILTRWVAERFGPGVEIPLDVLYAEFFRDRDAIARECLAVEAELAELDRAIGAALLGGAATDPDRSEVVVDRDRMAAVLAGRPSSPPAVCDPDVLFAAASREDLAEGRFTAVIGDCHAVREVITHTSFGPLIQEHTPELLSEVYRGYQSLLADDEVLANLSRGHPDKSSTQLVYPCHDLEVYGRSAQTRDRVLQPSQLYLVLRGDRLELRARGVEGRLRLMAPPAGGPSIRQDPLSPFAFPRHFGGAGLNAPHLAHIPRIRCGRVVLQRETWRIPAERLRDTTALGRPTGRDDAARFVAACRLRAEHRLPRHVFVKVPGEPKPVYVDWESPLLVRQLGRLAARAEGTLEISEMLPAPDQRWLEVDGQRYTSELRCAVFSAGDGAGAWDSAPAGPESLPEPRG
ncbi:lantibiotic dehydratase [Kitasatospora sp. NPDC058048]|uniref:lantibiotic dehydratase n=1 Tax=Kitasatospora sp. NPDC058048 TaxID=3346313 RepID=UPI0036DC8C78